MTTEEELLKALNKKGHFLSMKVAQKLKEEFEKDEVIQEMPIDFLGGTQIDVIHSHKIGGIPNFDTDTYITFCIEVKKSDDPWVLTELVEYPHFPVNWRLGHMFKKPINRRITPKPDPNNIMASRFLMIGSTKKSSDTTIKLNDDEGYLFQTLKSHYAYCIKYYMDGIKEEKSTKPNIVVPVLVTNADIYRVTKRGIEISDDGEADVDPTHLVKINAGFVLGNFFASKLDLNEDERKLIQTDDLKRCSLWNDPNKPKENPWPILDLIYVINMKSLCSELKVLSDKIIEVLPQAEKNLL